VLGAVIIVVVLLVVLPVSFLIGGAIVAAILGSSLNADADNRYEGSELIDLGK
jgi:flagellar basal body-associated protein FliL